jgi:hypothetical protein
LRKMQSLSSQIEFVLSAHQRHGPGDAQDKQINPPAPQMWKRTLVSWPVMVHVEKLPIDHHCVEAGGGLYVNYTAIEFRCNWSSRCREKWEVDGVCGLTQRWRGEPPAIAECGEKMVEHIWASRREGAVHIWLYNSMLQEVVVCHLQW